MISLDLPPSSNSLNSALLRAFGSNGAGALGVLDRAPAVLLFTFVFAFTVVRLVLSFGSGGVIFPGAFSSGGVFKELIVSLSIVFEAAAVATSAVVLLLSSLASIVAIGGCRRW